ncbi:HAMP domain-containing sensor histidine kinase [Cyanobium gracile]|uniref:histidine kinase n=1 Tax=Cyanobium gracile UHCC 0281 TaxID=3110309 RepID=A0ABU5SXR7_9CYAN|nr:HAMP domain-containing sensor histidine kinase [Cyanobium gracile]MEA5443293.1 HAMP domain-containing sensor histidine kinase [Cyanobium gracile UHCC 0281]
MRPDLSRLRRQLTLRYALFSVLLLLVFAAAVYRQVSEARRSLLSLQLQQLASTAAAELPLLHHEHDEMARGNLPQHPKVPLTADFATVEWGADHKRIRWFDPDLQELVAEGDFQPAGTTVPPPARRGVTTVLPLANGMAIWRPVISRSAPGTGKPALDGYVSVALSSAAAEAELTRLRQGLLIGIVVAGLVAAAGGQWLVGVSLRPVRRQIEKLVRFTADASHELRHPLTAIRALIGTLRHGSGLEGAQPVVGEKLMLIDQTTDRMGRLVDDLLLLTRFDRQIDDRIGMVPFQLEELVEDLADLYQDSSREQGLRLITDLQGPAHVVGHPQQLRQLLGNLLVNALRFSPRAGTVTLALRLQGEAVQVWVDDQGPGIPPEQRQLVFERFWQADASRSGSANTGLGLAIARSIAEVHHGKLQAIEAPGGGCRMQLTLARQA